MSYHNSVMMASMKVVAGIVVYESIEHKMLYTIIGSMAWFERNCSLCKARFGKWQSIIFLNSLSAIHNGFASFILHDKL